MNSRWQANKIGLVNFWYYDEQEFYFVKGRMLLRGSNGSGKSVTMQSFVPLLLDGNLSPERLDPFGSRDRKMSNYLLEDEDEREERTGYLYLEFKRQESDTYHTIGMGIRARKGKPLEKWYFYIADGRRVNQDFYLYKETDEKVTLSKKELENRLGSGGGVIDRQGDYAEYVNRQIFGYDTPEEYKEMIDLLIQLRTPKLSKDFKPSVINDILSDSLQPLSEEDLRPMSEAIENMDTLTANLKSKQESRGAAGKIGKVYDRFNRFMLYKKAEQLKGKKEELDTVVGTIANHDNQLARATKEIRRQENNYQELEAELSACEKEKESLSTSDAVSLKQREEELKKSVELDRQNIAEKEKQLAEKQEKYIEYQTKKKQEEEKQEGKQREINNLLEEMEADAEGLQYSEFAFLKEEVKNTEKECQFQLYLTQTARLKSEIEQGLETIRQADRERRQIEEEIKKLDGKKRDRDHADRKVREGETLLTEIQNEYKEKVYRWNKENQQLVLNQELLQEISTFADTYGEASDYPKIRQKVADVSIALQSGYVNEQNRLGQLINQADINLKDLHDELTEWQHQKEPEPERSQGVERNREFLRQAGIPFREFYKVIEFDQNLSESQCNRLEEALLHMGVLDALIIDEEYRTKVLSFDTGRCDRYLFLNNTRLQKSLLELFDIDGDNIDMFLHQRIVGLLQSIGYEAGNVTDGGRDGIGASLQVDEHGRYEMGILTGTVTGDYEAGFIGIKAREKRRQAKITELLSLQEAEEKIKLTLEEELATVSVRLEKVRREFDVFPPETDLRIAFSQLAEARWGLELVQKEISTLETQIMEMNEAVKQIWEAAVLIAEKLYFKCRPEVFEEARKQAEHYQTCLYQLKSEHSACVQLFYRLGDIVETMADLDGDMDTIRYDKRKFERVLLQDREELKSIGEQLALTDYEEIKERLNYCITRLMDIPREKEECRVAITENTGITRELTRQLDELAEKRGKVETGLATVQDVFAKELELKLIELPEGQEYQQVMTQLEHAAGWNRDSMMEQLNQSYFENRGFLVEYQLTTTTLFEELEQHGSGILARRLDIQGKFRGTKVSFSELIKHLEDEIEELKQLLKDGDRELFEDILANTVSRKIRGKINGSLAWVEGMNKLMGGMNTSSGLKLNLRWRSKTAEVEDQLDTKELVELLKKDYRTMKEEEAEKLSGHFRSKVDEARRNMKDGGGSISFYSVMRDTLDYRKWFEFQLFSQKSGERQKELTNSVFGTFSGGEKAMSMYVPLFSAVVAKYKGGRADAPRIISLDEAFAGVDNKNIRDMFRLMVEFEFNFIINSQVLWGDCDTLDGLAIYQLLRPDNVKFVTVMPYLWNGRVKVAAADLS